MVFGVDVKTCRLSVKRQRMLSLDPRVQLDHVRPDLRNTDSTVG
ncbi:MAG TPA: hypothetical protein VFK47_10735 [Ktedonobacteraceae bacterium]|nr:hypothetical protein [Ktedonobacteraceae bacterium]